MTPPTTTIILRGAFPTPTQALEFAGAAMERAATGGVTVQILAGSSSWPDPARRYRVTASIDEVSE